MSGRDFASKAIDGGAPAAFTWRIAPECFVCGNDATLHPTDNRSPLCIRCLPVRRHVVSMQTGAEPFFWVAKCQCGWSIKTDSRVAREDAVKAHWEAACGRAGS